MKGAETRKGAQRCELLRIEPFHTTGEAQFDKARELSRGDFQDVFELVRRERREVWHSVEEASEAVGGQEGVAGEGVFLS